MVPFDPPRFESEAIVEVLTGGRTRETGRDSGFGFGVGLAWDLGGASTAMPSPSISLAPLLAFPSSFAFAARPTELPASSSEPDASLSDLRGRFRAVRAAAAAEASDRVGEGLDLRAEEDVPAAAFLSDGEACTRGNRSRIP